MPLKILIGFLLLSSAFLAADGGTERPFFSGPLLAKSGMNNFKGQWTLNPYLYFTRTYGRTDASWKHRAIPDIHNSIYFFSIQRGLTDYLDLQVLPSYQTNWSQGRRASGWADFTFIFGLQLKAAGRDLSKSNLRITLQEVLPTARYDHLNPQKKGLDGLGGGSYQTRATFIFEKLLFWIPSHPMDLTINVAVNFPAKVSVSGFNSYGGGRGTHGVVRPGTTFVFDGALEISLARKFAVTMELFAFLQNKTTFSGRRGRDEAGNPASSKAPSEIAVTLAPGLECFFTRDLFLIGGVWFSTASRNSTDFATGILSLNYDF